MTIKLRILALAVTFLFAGAAAAQTQSCPSNEAVCVVENGQTLSDVINGDTTMTGDRVNMDRIYQLQRDALYLMDSSVRNTGYHLRVYGEESDAGAIPQVYTTLNPTSGNRVGDAFFQEGNITFRNFSFSGVLPEDFGGDNANMSNTFVRTAAAGFDLVMDRLSVVNVVAQQVRAQSALRKFEMTNSVWANSGWLGDNGTNFGAGKGIDLRDGSIDSLIFRNNTFVNYTDRIIRHRSSTGPIQNMIFDHNTVINTVSYHGMFALGVVGESIQITNNLFYDAFAAGSDSSDVVRQEEFNESEEVYASNGNAKMHWISSVPNEITNWDVSNNVYTVTDDLETFYQLFGDGAGDDGNPDNGTDGDNDIIDEGDPITDHILSRISNPTTAFQEIDLTLTNVPASPIAMLTWYRTETGRTKETITFDAATDDYDRHTTAYFLNDFDASYPTSSPVYTAGEGNCPVGDLNWFPGVDVVQCLIATSVEQISGQVPTGFELGQNYPNPFNPNTNITYALPKASTVSLVVYNVLGREVARLIDGQPQAAGVYRATWNGVDATGSRVASGIYFYQLQSAGTQVTKTMTLLK